MPIDDERIALFLDYENLAIGAREALGGGLFDFQPIADALAERGRVVVRRAYADWSSFSEDRRMLTRQQVELIEIPQRLGTRKNAADIKMAVDAIELCFERDYVTTFVLGTGDSDFTPLVHKLRELNRRVVGIGIEASTSALLPAACDEFLFYERLAGVDLTRPRAAGRRNRREPAKAAAVVAGEGVAEEGVAEEPAAPGTEDIDLGRLVTSTLSGLERSADGPVLASMLKRAILRKDPTFNEANFGFRGFGELLRNLADRGIVELAEGSAAGDPSVTFATAAAGDEEAAFELLRSTVERLGRRGTPLYLSGLKTQIRKNQGDFSEKRFGYGGFLQFCKAARARGLIEMDWDPDADDYVVRAVAPDTVSGNGAAAPGAGGDAARTGEEPAPDAAKDAAKEPAKRRGRR
ncbi:MAG TPA: NYN domain-containing protein [Acidimicrobiia bacterium]|nr:NYN domain-containing protein [Acidimicrobiia bacterium]